MNSVLRWPSCRIPSLTRETEGDWDETKGTGHINYTHSLGGNYYQRVMHGPTARWRDRGMETIIFTECPVCLRREGVFVLSSKTPAGC